MDLENIIQFSFKIVAIFSILKIDVDLGGINGIYLHQLTPRILLYTELKLEGQELKSTHKLKNCLKY